jgi:pyruvate dehydrogenase E2 component (dihydrolipoamide acetyltransferase)
LTLSQRVRLESLTYFTRTRLCRNVMAIEVVVPRLGWSMDEGTFGEWLARDGEFVKSGQALFVLEGEKSAQDIESFDQGILRIPSDAPRPGDIVKVGQVLAFLVNEGEAAPFERASGIGGDGAQAEATTAETPVGSIEDRICAPLKSGPEQISSLKASPRARRLAARTGVDLANLQGTGRTGRIRERDVLAAAGAKPQAISGAIRDSAPVSTRSINASGAPLAHAISPIRRTIAARMLAGAHKAAPVTLTTRCDATNLVSLRAQFRATAGAPDEIVPDYNDLIVKLTATALGRHPIMTARWTDQEIVFADAIHISIAVDSEAGLLAPVVRDVSSLTLRQLAAEIYKLTSRARSGELSADEMHHGVFTITNLGMFGVDAFTPIINLPQAAILGVGAIVRAPAVVDDKIVARDQLTLSLTFDHRVVDGAPAARFLKELRQGIEHPGAWLVL